MTDYRAGYSTGWSDAKDGLSVQRDAAASLLWLGQSSPGDELPPKAKPFLDRSEPRVEICPRCDQPIESGQETAIHVTDGRIHYRCGKIGKMHGRLVAPSEPSSASSEPTESFAELMGENSALQHRVETLTAALSEENRGKPACYDCGLAYGEDGWIECVLPNDVWRQIGPTGHDGGLLCITCIARRAKRAGLTKVPAMLCGTEAIRVADQEEAFNRGWDCAESALKELRTELDSLRSERAADRQEIASQFAAFGWNLTSIEDAANELERLSALARTPDHQDAERWRWWRENPEAVSVFKPRGEIIGFCVEKMSAGALYDTPEEAVDRALAAARTPALPETSNG